MTCGNPDNRLTACLTRFPPYRRSRQLLASGNAQTLDVLSAPYAGPKTSLPATPRVHSGSPASGLRRGTYLPRVGFQKLQHVAEHLRPAEFQSMPILLKDYELAMMARFPHRFLN